MISFNAPVTLTLVLVAMAEITVASVVGPWFTSAFFVSPGHLFILNPLDYLRSVSYIFGHVSWDHCLGNVMLLLILGPLLEEKYGSFELACCILLTAMVSSFVDSVLGLRGLGASGIVFMYIVMSSFGSSSRKKIPLTMILVVFLYVGREVLASIWPDPRSVALNISHLGHILGGVFGLFFGLIYNMLPDEGDGFFRRKHKIRTETPMAGIGENLT